MPPATISETGTQKWTIFCTAKSWFLKQVRPSRGDRNVTYTACINIYHRKMGISMAIQNFLNQYEIYLKCQIEWNQIWLKATPSLKRVACMPFEFAAPAIWIIFGWLLLDSTEILQRKWGSWPHRHILRKILAPLLQGFFRDSSLRIEDNTPLPRRSLDTQLRSPWIFGHQF